MSADELADARRRIKSLRLPIMERPTRRFALHPRGRRIDLRKTLRQSMRGGGAIIDIAKRKRLRRPPPLVILCDISGSMSRYSRMLLLFMHTIASDRERVHSFVFGTRLTNVSRYLQESRRRRGAREGRRGGQGLVRRHAHRPLPRRVQQELVQARAGPGCGRDDHHRRPRPRRRRGPRGRDGAAAQVVSPSRLAEPAVAL